MNNKIVSMMLSGALQCWWRVCLVSILENIFDLNLTYFSPRNSWLFELLFADVPMKFVSKKKLFTPLHSSFGTTSAKTIYFFFPFQQKKFSTLAEIIFRYYFRLLGPMEVFFFIDEVLGIKVVKISKKLSFEYLALQLPGRECMLFMHCCLKIPIIAIHIGQIAAIGCCWVKCLVTQLRIRLRVSQKSGPEFPLNCAAWT